MRPLSISLALTLSLALAGCSPVNVRAVATSGTTTTLPTGVIIVDDPNPPLSPFTNPPVYYNAYGDSITYGAGVTNPSTNGYPALLAAYLGIPHNDFSLVNSQSCDIPKLEIFPNSDSPTLTRPALYTLLIGTNDAAFAGTGPYEANFNLCQQASISWLAMPAEDKILATSSVVTTSGANHIETANNWSALATDAQGASIKFPLQLASTGPVYVWYRITDGNPGAFTCSLDGAIIASATTATTTPILTTNGSSSSLGLLRLPAIPSGSHTLTFTQTTPGTYGMGIVAVGVVPASLPANMPQVYVGTVPPQLIGGGGACAVYPSICNAYNADITSNVSLLKSDGLNVVLFNTGKYMTATSADMNDAIHPNNVGNQEIFQAIQDVLIP